MNYSKGSEWRKWDLHVHTPCSALNNQFPKLDSGEPDWEAYVEALEAVKDVAVLGITDYFSIEGYKKILEYRDRGRLADFDLVLPNVELRLDTFVVKDKYKDINFHVIFSNTLAPEEIEKDFLEALTIKLSGSTTGQRGKRQLTKRSLEEAGRLVKRNQTAFAHMSDFEAGVANVTVSLDQVQSLLNRELFCGKHVLVLAGGEWNDIDWNQAYVTKKNFLQSADFLETSSPSTISWARGERDLPADDLVREFGCLKPCIRGSDAHSLETICNPDDGRPCWIKADPTFEGLRQVINEPLVRVFIGHTPPELMRVDQSKTKYLDSVLIGKREEAGLKEVWFGDELIVPLNPGLVAVIGRKGSGKSALADTIALLGDVPVSDSFSFLNKRKFRDPKNNKARFFEAELRWASGGSSGLRGLDADADKGKPLSVKYIPQNYLEEICNEIVTASGSGFNRELEEVIFSHVEEARRLGKSTLEELIEYKTSEVRKDLEFTKRSLRETNKRVAALQERLQPDYKGKLLHALAEKERELKVHLASKPKETDKPIIQTSVQSELDSLNVGLEQANVEIAGLESERKAIVSKLAVIDRLLERIKNFEREFEQFKNECQSDMEELGIAFDNVVALQVDTRALNANRQLVERQISELDGQLDSRLDNSKLRQKLKLEARLKEISTNLDAANARYQEYLKSIRVWESKKAEIKGDAETPGTLQFYAKQVSALKELPKELDQLLGERVELTRLAFSAKRKLAEVYTDLYAPVENFIQSETLSMGPLTMSFDVYISCEGFEGGFLEFINQQRQGSFHGLDEGRRMASMILDRADVNTEEGVLDFVREVIDHLEEDKQKAEPRTVAEQVGRKYSASDLYDYVFSLNYLKPKYRLMWAGKTIEQLSPGERGTLLLVFYLLIDKRDIPLVIDQPEENLDNQTVYELLVPCIKEARRRRQVIIVTHNPNLAVVCDAEQVIHSDINREEGNKVTYTSGSIENPTINQLIVDVLEGTRPAFDNRESKYMD